MEKTINIWAPSRPSWVNSGRAAPSYQANAGSSWPGGKAVFKMKISLWLLLLLAFIPICIWLRVWQRICLLKKKKNSGESFLFRHRLREKTRDSHSLLSQAAHNWVEVRGCSKLSVSNPQLSSFLTEALGSRADGVSPVHVSSADRNPRLEAVCLEQRETPSLALSWCSQRTVKTLLKPEPT